MQISAIRGLLAEVPGNNAWAISCRLVAANDPDEVVLKAVAQMKEQDIDNPRVMRRILSKPIYNQLIRE